MDVTRSVALDPVAVDAIFVSITVGDGEVDKT